MKRIVIIFIAIFAIIITHNCIAQNQGDLKVKEINYGESNAQKLYESKMKKSPSGHHNIASDELNIIKRTDTIKAEVGAQFGVEYEVISPKNELVAVQITWLFPDGMKNQNGKNVKEMSYDVSKVTNTYTYSNYTLEGENEVVRGQWVFIISKDGKELYRKIFFLK
jgi:hypothetical protein